MQVIDEDHYAPKLVYKSRPMTLSKDSVGTRYLMIAIGTRVDPSDPQDLDQVHALQDAIKVNQPGGPGTFEILDWDQASQKKVRNASLVLASTITQEAVRREGRG